MGKLMAREKQFMAAMLFDKSFRFAVSSDADLPLEPTTCLQKFTI
jgi:hypothetical protein